MARRIIAALLLIVASLLAPFAVGALWAERTITSSEQFTETLAPLAQDPVVREVVGTEVTTALIDAIDAESRAQTLLGNLDGPLAGLRSDRGVDSVLAAAIASGVNDAITTGVDSYVTSDRFGQGWNLLTAALQEQFVALLEDRDPDSAVTLVQGQIVLDTGVALDRVQQQLAEQGVPFAGKLDVPGRQIVLADTPNLQLVADALAVFLPVAAWLWVVVVAMFVGGILLWRPRSRAVLWTGIGLSLGALLAYVGLDLGTATISEAAPTGFGPLVGTVLATLLRFLINALLVMLTLGLALILGGWLAGATGTGRRARLAITTASHRWGSGLSDSGLARYTSEHPMFVPTLRLGVLVVAGGYLVLADRLSPAQIVWTAVGVALGLLAVEVIEGAGLGREAERTGALVASGAGRE